MRGKRIRVRCLYEGKESAEEIIDQLFDSFVRQELTCGMHAAERERR